MPQAFPRLIVAFLCLSFLSQCTLVAKPAIPAVSENLVWKPYLQQLSDTRVIILWTTHTGSNPTVRYGPQFNDLPTVAAGSSQPMAGVRLHRVELSGLQPDTTYYYKIYTEGEDLLPYEQLFFRTAPLTGSATPFTFIVLGDYGQNSASQKRLRDQMRRDSFNFILTTGDNAYEDGTYAEFHTNVFLIYQELFSKTALFPALGNHDYRTADGAPYLDIFDLPGNAWRRDDLERYYSFDFGNVHIVVLDSNAPLDGEDYTVNDDMFDWLRSDLSRTAQPWKIVTLHHSPYSAGLRHGSDLRMRSMLGPILEAYDVDIVLSGHEHTYQRSKPLRGGQEMAVGEGGIVYIVSGAGSSASYACGRAEWLVVAYCAESYGLYTRITVDGYSLTVEAIDEEGVVKDSFSLTKETTIP